MLGRTFGETGIVEQQCGRLSPLDRLPYLSDEAASFLRAISRQPSSDYLNGAFVNRGGWMLLRSGTGPGAARQERELKPLHQLGCSERNCTNC